MLLEIKTQIWDSDIATGYLSLCLDVSSQQRSEIYKDIYQCMCVIS